MHLQCDCLTYSPMCCQDFCGTVEENRTVQAVVSAAAGAFFGLGTFIVCKNVDMPTPYASLLGGATGSTATFVTIAVMRCLFGTPDVTDGEASHHEKQD